MRKFEQKQLLELVETMKAAAGMLGKIYSSKEAEAFREILAGQQEAAISIGTRLEGVLNDEADTLSAESKALMKETVEVLELYCELVWNISNTEGQVQLQESVATLQEALLQIEKNIQQMPVRLEVAFLPYKASMWDCMETVWVAACEDKDCDVYVVPIPYYDLKPDGSAGEMHYEAALMPKKVPVTDFRRYKVEERRPDIIYIHNPYDEYNKVTSVHPDYYSSKLQNYTDMLVYIPYFLLGEHLAESHSLLPAYVYADKIVLNAETQIEDIDHSIPREKFIVAGSTKAERLQWMEQHKNELDVPADWKRKMEGKKVVFYNLSISGLLKYREKMLAKMDEVFSVFEKKEDVVMLYRPHPLIESTLTSMCPELLEDYQALVKRVKKMKNAIYDTTPDAAVAVALCDAYIGESSSSMVDMFRVLQKPLFYLNEKMYYQPTLDEMLSDKTLDVCRVVDDLWFITRKTQLLCKYNMKTDVMECVAEIPDAKMASEYIKLVHYENKLILIPYMANAVCVYDMETGTFRKDYFRDEKVIFQFWKGAVYEHYLYLMPLRYPAIVRYDVLSGEFAYYTECVKDVYSQINDDESKHPFADWSVWNNMLFITSPRTNNILSFDMSTEEYTICKLGEETRKYAAIAADENDCWLQIYEDCSIVRWNRKTGEVKVYNQIPPEFDYQDYSVIAPYTGLLSTSDRIYLISGCSNKSLQLLKETGEITVDDFERPYQENTLVSEFYKLWGGTNHVFAKMISDNEIAACANYDDSLVILNTDDKSCKKTPIRIKRQLQTEAKKYPGNLKEMGENANIPLSKYLEFLSEELMEANIKVGMPVKKMDDHIGVGKMIHEQVKGVS